MKKYLVTWTMVFSILFAGSLSAWAGTLSVPQIYQQQNQWCWAASCQMILSYYGTSTTQCWMANWCFGQSTCCNSVVWDPYAPITSCNSPNWIFGYSGDMEDVLINRGAIYGVGTYAALPWVTFQSEIDGGRPFVIGFSWDAGGGHAMVGRGYSGSYGYYNDPWPGNGPTWSLYSWMVYAPSHHTWDQSYRLTTTPGSSDYPILAGGDYNGDGHDDIAIYRPSSGLWSVRGITRVYWGTSGDIPIPGDYGGHGTTDIGIFRPSSGLWAIRGYTRYYYGSSSDIPVPGDYDGNGACNVGIFHPSSGLWSIRGITRCYFGSSSDKPAPADYSGDNTTEICIFRESSGLWACRTGWRSYFGSTSDIPVPIDTTGNGRCGPAIYRPSTGLWAVRGWSRFYYGGSSDQPVPANFQGDIADEIAVFRASSGRWAIRGGNRYYFGQSGDIPVTR